jgi:hypothetical protein
MFVDAWVGRQWVLNLNTTVQHELNSGKDVPFIVEGKVAGEVCVDSRFRLQSLLWCADCFGAGGGAGMEPARSLL